MRRRSSASVLAFLAFVLCGAALSSVVRAAPPPSSSAPSDSRQAVLGAGAFLAAPLFTRWFAEYNKLHPDLRLDYQPVGSSSAIDLIGQRAVDFAATDAPLTEEQTEQLPAVVQLPAAITTIAVVYNLSAGPAAGVRLSSDVLADIFIGRISMWNDPRIVAQNPGARMPEVPITIVYRTGRSGTTFVFTDYLAKISSEWRSKVGVGASVPWPLGLGMKGGEAQISLVKGIQGAISYTELISAQRHRVGVATLGNAEGEFVRPSLTSAMAAAANLGESGDPRVMPSNPPGRESYPLVAFTYLLVFPDQSETRRGRALLNFLWWALHDGQQYAGPLGMVPLARGLQARAEATLRGLTVQGVRVLEGRAP